MNSSQCSITFSQPNVVIGEYETCVHFILKEKYNEWVIPKVLWIDFRVIPLILLHNFSHQRPALENIYFMEFLSIDDYNYLIKPTILSEVIKKGFSSVIIHHPPNCANNNEIWMYIKKLAKLCIITVLTSRELFPVEESTHFVVESG